MFSCSPEDNNSVPESQSTLSVSSNYEYSPLELETMELINNYRVSIGLKALEKVNYVSLKSEEHDNYMITNNVVNHDDFVSRSENIIKVLGAKSVGENVAYNYNSAKGAFDAWLNSSAHKENIVGDYTHFGISVRENPVTGKKYYTNIFVKI
ncbi:CAP domain-containing protein [Flavobacterium aestivum]|uniref:CAP domain-containing protein n=1 Tax=Flavobacterium aestivum TaxID=3003257 RepID=UPI002482E8F3|nr:CAP domain-containing protein [Flavobacterium aestivum]